MTSRMRRGIWESARHYASWVLGGGPNRITLVDDVVVSRSTPASGMKGTVNDIVAESVVTYPDIIDMQSALQMTVGCIHDVAYDGTRWAHVHHTNTTSVVSWTTNAVTWTTATSNLNYPKWITYGGGTWVISNAYGGIRTSTNLTTWTTRVSGAEDAGATSSKVVYNGTIWVISADTFIQTSTDGTTWTTRNSSTGTDIITTVAYVNSKWIVPTSGATAATSTDAITWTTLAGGVATSWAVGCAYFNGAYYFLDWNSEVWSSTDLVTWDSPHYTVPNSPSAGFISAYDGFLWIGGDTYLGRSSDGSTWTIFDLFNFDGMESNEAYAEWIGAIAGETFLGCDNGAGYIINSFTEGRDFRGFLAGDSGSVASSTDGITWTTGALPTGGNSLETLNATRSLNGISLDGTAILAIGQQGSIQRSWTSTPSTWENLQSTVTNKWYGHWDIDTTPHPTRALEYNGGTWVAVGVRGVIQTSTDGTTWTTRTGTFGTTTIHAVKYGGGTWIAVGATGTLSTSTNGTTWTTRTSLFGTTTIQDVAYNGTNLWIAVGNAGQIRSSTDGTTWTTRTSALPTGLMYGVAYGGGTWVAVGSTGLMQTSTDGITWTSLTSPSTGTAPRVHYINGVFYFASDREILSSTNGSTWVTRASCAPYAGYSAKIAYGDGIYMMMNSLPSDGGVFTSTDGITWSSVVSGNGLDFEITPAGSDINGIAYGGGTWVAITDIGNLLTAPTRKNITPNTINDITSFVDNTWWSDFETTSVAVGGSGTVIELQTLSARLMPILPATLRTQTSHYQFKTLNNRLVGVFGFVMSTDGVTWTTSNGGPYIATDIAYGGGTYASVGWYGICMTSTDAITWATTAATTFGTTNIYGIAYGGGTWVLAGSTGQLRTTTDFVTWVTRTPSPTSSSFNDMTYGGGTWVGIFSYLGTITVSTDGTTWTSRVVDYASVLFTNVEYVNSRWFIGGLSSYTSTDTITWTACKLPVNRRIVGVTYTDSAYWAVTDTSIEGNYSYLLTSTDCITWTVAGVIGTDARGIGTLGSGSIYYATASRIYKYDTSTKAQADISQDLVGVVYDGAYVIVLGLNGALWTSYEDLMWTFQEIVPGSYPADMTWTTRAAMLAEATPSDVMAVAYGPTTEHWVAVAFNGKLSSSTDGITWTTRTSTFGTTGIRAVAYGGGTWVAAGNSGQMRVSTDGVTWTTVTSTFGTTGIWAIAYGGGTWVAAGAEGQIRTSTNTTTWTTRTSYITGGDVIYSVAYGGGTWVVVGSSGVIRSSSDGTTWTTRTSAFQSLYSVAYGNNKFVAGCWYSTTYVSTDGTTWTTGYVGPWKNDVINAIAYGNGMFVAGRSSTGFLHISNDGERWHSVPISGVVDSLAYGNGLWVVGFTNAVKTSPLTYMKNLVYENATYVATGSNGIMYTSSDLTTWTSRATGLTGVLTADYSPTAQKWLVADDTGAAKTSTDLVTWTTVVSGFGTSTINIIKGI